MDQLLVRGFLKFRLPRGCCEVRGAGPNLWFAVAGALGFRVTTIRCAYPLFVDLIGSFCGGPWSLSPWPRQCNSLPDVVFLDLGALPWGPGSDKYWERWWTPHVFYCQGADNDLVKTRAGAPPPHMPNGVDFVLYCAEPLRRRGCNFRTLDHGGLVSTSFAFLGAPAGGSSGLVSPLLIHPRQRVGCPPPYSPLWGLSGPYGGPVRGLGTGLGPLSGLGIGGQGPGSVLFEPVGLRCLSPRQFSTWYFHHVDSVACSLVLSSVA